MFLQYLRDSQTKSLQHCCRLISEVHCQGWKVLHEVYQENSTVKPVLSGHPRGML